MIAPSDRGLSGHGGGFRRRRHKEDRFMLSVRVIPVQFRGQLLGLCLFEALCAGAGCTGDRRGPMNGSSEKCLPGVMQTKEPENQVTLVTQTICLAKKCLDLIVDAFHAAVVDPVLPPCKNAALMAEES